MIEILQGDITDEDTDAIANPTNTSFSLGGAIAKAISAKGGPQIGNDCAQLGTLSTCALSNAAGQLNCKHIVHVVSPQNINECQTLATELLNFAVQKSLHSVSVPLIGAGGNKLPRDQVATCITDASVLAANNKILGTLTRIRLVGYTADEKDAFEKALQQSLAGGASPGSQMPSPPPVQSPQPPIVKQATIQNPSLSGIINGVNFEVALGSLTDEQSDAIVNPSNETLGLDGNLSQAIVANGGDSIAKECLAIGSIPADGAVVTGAGSLQCKHIVHVVSPSNVQECEQAVCAAIKSAALKGVKSLTFPPIGGGAHNVPLDEVAGCIVDTLAEAANRNDIGSLTLVRLVGFKVAEKDAFERALEQALMGIKNIQNAPEDANAVSFQYKE